MSFSGDLKGIQLADVFQNIHSNRLTGTIQVTTRQGQRYIFFRDGMVVAFSLGQSKGMPVADHLLQRAYVDQESLQTASKKKTKSRKPLRVILSEMRLLTEDEFRGALAELLEENLYEVLMLKEATYEFTEGDPPARVFDGEQKTAGLRLDPNGILMESARRKDGLERIRSVVLSDRDVFVALEGWEELPDLDEVTPLVAERLDGRTDIQTILAELPYSRFDVLRAVTSMVMGGTARPLSANEVEAMAEQALRNGDLEDAASLLARALMLERSNRDLRMRLVEVYEELGRPEEAANELALLGYQEAEAGEIDMALELYAKAAELNPSDLPLQERRLQLLQSTEDYESYAEVALEFTELLLTMGLADRARSTLQACTENVKLRYHAELLEKLAEVEVSLGHEEQASQVYLDLANNVAKKDEEQRLGYLRLAARYRPDDEALLQRVSDLETGQHKRRRTRRRKMVTWVASLVTLMALGTAGIVEIVASHRLLQSFEGHLQPIVEGQPSAALQQIEAVHKDYSWTFAGRRAQRMHKRMLQIEIRGLEEMMRVGLYREALDALKGLQAAVQRADVQRTLQALSERCELELKAQLLFDRVNQETTPDEASLQSLRQLTDPRHLDFLVARLEDRRTLAHTRACLLTALRAIHSPRAVPVVARVCMTSKDPLVDELCRQILEQAKEHRKAGRDQGWQEIHAELEAAAGKAGPTQKRAQQLLGWLKSEQ